MTPDQVIQCPHCKKDIPLTEALSHQLRQQLQMELEADLEKKRAELATQEDALAKKQKNLATQEAEFTTRVNKQVQLEKAKLEMTIKAQTQEAYEVQVKDLTSQLDEKAKKLKESQTAELGLREKVRAVEEKEKDLDLLIARRVDEQGKKLREDTLKSFQEGQKLKDAEKDQVITGLKDTVAELQRKIEQGSQQSQGEVLELELEDILRANFPQDQIEPVPKGIRGADILQRVTNGLGQPCGTIIWESKHTKAWSDGWLQKIKDDQRAVKADLAVIMSVVVPKDLKHFARLDGVWVSECPCVLSLAQALRISLIEVTNARLAATGKNEKIELLYQYLSGPEFRQRVEGIVEAFNALRVDLEQEKKAMHRIWAKREKQIDRVTRNTVGMYGDMQGIIGSSLPQIEQLELKAIPAGPDLDLPEEEADTVLGG